jgi:hypothetical protein
VNQFTNTLNLNNSMNIDAYEIQEARRRMGTLNNQVGMAGTGITGLGQGQNITSFQNVPSLRSSSSVGSGEIQKVRQKINQSTPQNTQMY